MKNPKKLPGHPRAHPSAAPPRELLRPFIKKELETVAKHWRWKGDFSSYNEPIFKWNYEGDGWTFFVAKIIYGYVIKPVVKGTSFVNTCGDSQCINPLHWHSRTPEEHAAARKTIVLHH